MRALLSIDENAAKVTHSCKTYANKQAAIDAFLQLATAARKRGKRYTGTLSVGADPHHPSAPIYQLSLTPRGSVRITEL
jgi:hypothetical protein